MELVTEAGVVTVSRLGRGDIFKIHLRDTFVQAGEGKIQMETS